MGWFRRKPAKNAPPSEEELREARRYLASGFLASTAEAAEIQHGVPSNEVSVMLDHHLDLDRLGSVIADHDALGQRAQAGDMEARVELSGIVLREIVAQLREQGVDTSLLGD